MNDRAKKNVPRFSFSFDRSVLVFQPGGAKEAIAKLPNDIKGYPLEALATGTATDSSKLAQGKALMLIFATPT